eukprot:3004529-Rhodomonas_salina.2
MKTRSGMVKDASADPPPKNKEGSGSADKASDEEKAAWALCTYAVLFTDSEKLTPSLVAYITQKLNNTPGLAKVQVKHEKDKIRFIIVRLGGSRMMILVCGAASECGCWNHR